MRGGIKRNIEERAEGGAPADDRRRPTSARSCGTWRLAVACSAPRSRAAMRLGLRRDAREVLGFSILLAPPPVVGAGSISPSVRCSYCCSGRLRSMLARFTKESHTFQRFQNLLKIAG